MTSTSSVRTSSRWLAVALSLVVPLVAACTPEAVTQRQDLRWPWWPVRMDVSTLSRVGRVGEDGLRPVEVRLQFLDVDGHPTKATGMVEVSIERATQRGAVEVREFDLADPTVQRRHFESVTGCYMFPIRIEQVGMVEGRVLDIDAVYRGGDGVELRAGSRLVLGRDLRASSPEE